jgi:hypothetical protein
MLLTMWLFGQDLGLQIPELSPTLWISLLLSMLISNTPVADTALSKGDSGSSWLWATNLVIRMTGLIRGT